jgi:hypothetical protein
MLAPGARDHYRQMVGEMAVPLLDRTGVTVSRSGVGFPRLRRCHFGPVSNPPFVLVLYSSTPLRRYDQATVDAAGEVDGAVPEGGGERVLGRVLPGDGS